MEILQWLEVLKEHFCMFFRAAFLEEGLKFALLIFFCVRLSDLNEPMDAIVYGAAIGLGYAAMENIPYLNTGDPETAWTMTCCKRKILSLNNAFRFWCSNGLVVKSKSFRRTKSI